MRMCMSNEVTRTEEILDSQTYDVCRKSLDNTKLNVSYTWTNKFDNS